MKRLAERSRDAVDGMETWPAYDEHADILAELAETQAALHAATNDVVRLAAELHTAHGQVDRVRRLAMRWETKADAVAITYQNPDQRRAATAGLRRNIRDLLDALDGGAS